MMLEAEIDNDRLVYSNHRTKTSTLLLCKIIGNNFYLLQNTKYSEEMLPSLRKCCCIHLSEIYFFLVSESRVDLDLKFKLKLSYCVYILLVVIRILLLLRFQYLQKLVQNCSNEFNSYWVAGRAWVLLLLLWKNSGTLAIIFSNCFCHVLKTSKSIPEPANNNSDPVVYFANARHSQRVTNHNEIFLFQFTTLVYF